MSAEVVKVQVPLFPKGAGALVYPKEYAPTPGTVRVSGATNEQMGPGNRRQTMRLSKVTLDALGDDLKGYFLADWVDGKWKIGRRVADKGW